MSAAAPPPPAEAAPGGWQAALIGGSAGAPQRRLHLHVEGAGRDEAGLSVRHRATLVIHFRHVLTTHEIQTTGLPAGSTVVLGSCGGAPAYHAVSARVDGAPFNAELRRAGSRGEEPTASGLGQVAVGVADEPWGDGLRLYAGPLRGPSSTVTFRFAVAELAQVSAVGDAEKAGSIRVPVTPLLASASARAGDEAQALAVADSVAHAEVHMPIEIRAVEMRNVDSEQPEPWEMGTDRTFAALRAACALRRGGDGGAEVRVRLPALHQPCAVFRGHEDVDESSARRCAAGMIHVPPASLQAAKKKIAAGDVRVLHLLVDGTAAMGGAATAAARDAVLACLAALRSELVEGGRLARGRRLGLQLEVFGGAQALLMCPAGPVRCDAEGVAGAEKWAREHVHAGHSVAGLSGVGALERLAASAAPKGRRCVVLLSAGSGDAADWGRFNSSGAEALAQHTTVHSFLLDGAGCASELSKLAELTGGAGSELSGDAAESMLPVAVAGIVRSAVVPRQPALTLVEWSFRTPADWDSPDWSHTEPCHSLHARAGAWVIQTPLGGSLSDAATARVSLIDTAGVRHDVVTLSAACTLASETDPLVLLCARETVLGRFRTAPAQVCARQGHAGPTELATLGLGADHGSSLALESAAADAVALDVHVAPWTELFFPGVSSGWAAAPPVPALDTMPRDKAQVETFARSAQEAFVGFVESYIGFVRHRHESGCFWADAEPYTSPQETAAADSFARLVAAEHAAGRLDSCGESAALRAECERSGLPRRLQLQGLPVGCLHARVRRLLSADGGGAKGAPSRPQEAEDGSIEIFPCWDATVLEGRGDLSQDVEFQAGSLGLKVGANPFFGTTGSAEDAFAVVVEGFNDCEGRPGPAEASGVVREGDAIVAVAGVPVRGQSNAEVLARIKEAERPLTLSFCQPYLLEHSEGTALGAFGGAVPCHTVSRSFPGWGTSMAAVFAWDTEALETIAIGSKRRCAVSVEFPCRMFGQRPASVRHCLSVLSPSQLGVTPSVPVTLPHVVDSDKLADAIHSTRPSGAGRMLASFDLMAWTHSVRVVLPQSVIAEAIAANALVLALHECGAGSEDALRRLAGHCGTAAFGSGHESSECRPCLRVHESDSAAGDDDDELEVICGTSGGAESLLGGEGTQELLECVCEINWKLSQWDDLPSLARVIRLLPEGDATRRSVAERLRTLEELYETVGEAMECESLEVLDEAIALTSSLPGWRMDQWALLERRQALVLAAMKVAKALRSYDEGMIRAALRSAELFDSFAADVVTLGDRLEHVRQTVAAATTVVDGDGSVWTERLEDMLSQLPEPADEVGLFRTMSELAQLVEAFAARAEAARHMEKAPALRAEAELALSQFVGPIAATAKAEWPREVLAFVKRCAEPTRVSVEWLRQHFTPLRKSLATVESAAASDDAATIRAAVRKLKRHGGGLKKTCEGLAARAAALELAARRGARKTVTTEEAVAAIAAVRAAHPSLVRGLDEAMESLRALVPARPKSARKPAPSPAAASTPMPTAPENPRTARRLFHGASAAQPEPEPAATTPAPAPVQVNQDMVAALAAAAAAGNVAEITRLLRSPPPTASEVPETAGVPTPSPSQETDEPTSAPAPAASQGNSERLDQKRERRQARLRRTIAAARHSGEKASIEVAVSAASSAGLQEEADALSVFGEELETARRLMKHGA